MYCTYIEHMILTLLIRIIIISSMYEQNLNYVPENIPCTFSDSISEQDGGSVQVVISSPGYGEAG